MTEYIKSDDTSKLKDAVAILVSWRARMGDGLHVAAEMTELLLRAMILDRETDKRDWFALGYLRIVYSTVIIRVINYANELGQSTCPAFQSVAVSVRKLGIPSWVVQVRHAAAHNYFPSIGMFREAANFCRNWLWEIHWAKPINEAMDLVLSREVLTPTDSAASLIVSYMLFRMQNPKKRVDDQEMHSLGIIGNIYRFVAEDSSNFIRALLFDGNFIMTEDQMRIAGFRVFDGSEIWLIPSILQLFWEPLLKPLACVNALPELLYQLIAGINSAKNSFKERQFVAWADYMLTAFSNTDSISQIDWKRIMKAMLSARTTFGNEHYEMVMNKVSLISDKKRKQLRRLLDLSQNTSNLNVSGTENGPAVRTLDELRELIDAGIDGYSVEDPVTGEENWINCDPSVWRGVSLGLTPEQSSESLFLIIDKEHL